MFKFKFTAIRGFMIAALIIMLLYAFGLFLPIIKNSKPQSKIFILETELTKNVW